MKNEKLTMNDLIPGEIYTQKYEHRGNDMRAIFRFNEVQKRDSTGLNINLIKYFCQVFGVDGKPETDNILFDNETALHNVRKATKIEKELLIKAEESYFVNFNIK